MKTVESVLDQPQNDLCKEVWKKDKDGNYTLKPEAEKKITEARAEAEANALKQQTITDQVLKEKFIEKWDGKLSIVSGNANGFFDLDSILKNEK